VLAPFSALTEAQLDRVIAIYEEALAAPWEWPPALLRGLAEERRETRWALAALQEGDPAGFIVVEYLSGVRVWYIRYFAVRADLRGQGWGSAILTGVLDVIDGADAPEAAAGRRGVMLEAEALEQGLPDAERAVRTRRQAFYRRHGALVTGARAPRPPDAPAAMPEYDLLFIPSRTWQGRLDGALRRDLARALAVEGYGVPEDAAWLQVQLARYEG